MEDTRRRRRGERDPAEGGSMGTSAIAGTAAGEEKREEKKNKGFCYARRLHPMIAYWT